MTQMIDLRRRGLLRGSGITVLSASAVAILAGCERMAVAQSANGGSAANDVGILNTALALENEAISAYQLGAQSGLLQKPVLEVAVLFQTHHKEHRDALIATIRKLGGTPVAAKSDAEVAQALNASTLKTQTDVLRLAQRLEKGAANAYIGVIPSFGDRN
ncbi:MAG: ferritin-like domain-containing protein, partial [Reyranella sp.]|nr:ferritin-like domain-containing protein [Reyranella sp.]